MTEEKLLEVVNGATDLGKQLMKVGRTFMMLGMVAFGVALVADQMRVRRERADYADV